MRGEIAVVDNAHKKIDTPKQDVSAFCRATANRRSIVMIKIFLLGLLLASSLPSSYGQTPYGWGYIRVDNDGAFIISSKCYSESGDGVTKWKKTPAGGFRSCHGFYMRIDVQGSGGTRKMYFKRPYHCVPSQRMYVRIWGTTGSEHTDVTCEY